jgi:hypothetical protein
MGIAHSCIQRVLGGVGDRGGDMRLATRIKFSVKVKNVCSYTCTPSHMFVT